MDAGLSAIQSALDGAPSTVHFFLRDDDAGWDDQRLFALLDCTRLASVPIDLAVIPQATGAALARELCARIDAAPGLVGVHQHGFAHANHELHARKCEFGGARTIDAQRGDLRAGRDHLLGLFGARLDSIFTPPWNRCSAATPALLAELGYVALSRDRTAPAQQALPELAVDVDWSKQRRASAELGEADGDRIGAELAQRISTGGPVGLMLHHATMDASDLALLADVLALTARHHKAQWRLMRELVFAQAARVGAGASGPQMEFS